MIIADKLKKIIRILKTMIFIIDEKILTFKIIVYLILLFNDFLLSAILINNLYLFLNFKN